jgi:integrase
MRALDHASRRVRPWLVLAAWAGLRACEISGLRRENVLDSAVPPVLLVARDATKGSRERLLPLSPFLLAELQLAGMPSSGYVFRRHDGHPGPNRPWRISQLCNQCLHECGVQATLHQLRHRYGTQLYQSSGHDLRLTQDMLGHASPATTSVYAAWDRAGATAAVDALPVPDRLRVVSSEEVV